MRLYEMTRNLQAEQRIHRWEIMIAIAPLRVSPEERIK
jgi:hypothetical protein